MDHDLGDEAMANPSDLVEMSILSGEDIRLTQETTTTMAVQRSVADQHDTRRQIDQLAHCSAAAHQATVEQISQVQQHQDVIASKTAEYLQQQHNRQLELQEQQEQFRRQMAEQRKQIEEQLRLLKVAEAAVGEQGQRLQSLADAVRPHVEARWGLFAQTPMAESGGINNEARDCSDRTPTVTLATGANIPVPPLYRGSSKKEKRDFMDSYMVYKRRIDALNQGTQTQVFVMPIGACIEQSTLVRICRFELFKQETQVTEDDWKNYFLDARNPDYTAYQRLDLEMRKLAMDVNLLDAESRMSRLLADFYKAVDGVNMESIIHEDPKRVVGYLVDALRPGAFRSAIKDNLDRPAGKQLKKDVSEFLRWLKPQIEEFMKFETHISSNRSDNSSSSQQQQRGTTSRKWSGKQENTFSDGTKKGAATSSQAETAASKGRGDQGDRKSRRPSSGASRHVRSCFKCSDLTHSVFQCPQVTDFAEAKQLYETNTGKKARPEKTVGIARLQGSTHSSLNRTLTCRVMDSVDTIIKPDSGAEVSMIAPCLVEKLKANQVWLPRRNLSRPQVVKGVGPTPITITEETNLFLRFETPGGPLVLRNVSCLISPDPLPDRVGDILLSDSVMERLGYDPLKLIESARMVQSEYDLSDLGVTQGDADVFAFGVQKTDLTPEEQGLSEAEDAACFPVPNEANSDVKKVKTALKEGIEDAKAKGASPEFLEEVQKLLEDHIDVFRMALGGDPPVDMPPMRIKLKPGATPVRCRSRRYSAAHRDFLARHVKMLIDAGLCYRNPSSEWCSPPHVVPKDDDHRMTVDVREANKRVVPVVWPMPILEVEFDRLKGCKFYFSVDFFKGFWQFGVAIDCQEIYSILTEMGVITPTRVLMGGTNSVAYVQSTVQAMFGDLFNNGLLIWIDDLLGYADSPDKLLEILRKVLAICAKKGLKLNPKKCKFFMTEALWCGRVVSSDGVRHDPARIQALRNLPAPTTGQELQQFICALNWMRMSIPAFNKLVNPLVVFMEKVYAAAGGRKKSMVRRVVLKDVGWSNVEIAGLQHCKEALENALTLAHPDPEKRLCVFADASDRHWGAAITQVPMDHLNRDFADQNHEPLMMLSGTFSGGAKRWAIVEKEAFAIVETCKRADYLVRRPDGFNLYTDHRNLRYIFAPTTVFSAVPKYTADKLHRWSLLLMSLDYEIHDISGEANVWADLLSRWGSSFATVAAIRLESLPISPQVDESFVWPTLGHIQTAQENAANITPAELVKGADNILRDVSGRIWVPDVSTDLQLRLCIIGHFGAAGHRTNDVTLKNIAQRFFWSDLVADVKAFVSKCLHCASISGGPPFPRPLGEALHAEKPNEVLHFDFLSLGESSTGHNYVLVLKDDAANYVWLVPAISATADTTYDALLDWFAAFGICHTWVSDQGTHFKNLLIQALQRALGAHHHFTTARCPWANGTVEVVMREVLRCCRALLSEWRLAETEWPRVIKIVQLVLNQSPSSSLNGVAPVTVMTGLPAMNPVEPIVTPIGVEPATIADIKAIRGVNFEKLKEALEKMHKKVAEARNLARKHGRKKAAKRGFEMAQFAIGDFVLYADVWAHRRSKLRVKWCGPARVVDTSSNWIFIVENLLTGERREAHASRLKFFADAKLEVTEDLLAHVAHNSEGHVVEEFKDARYNSPAKTHELLVKWRGLTDEENSWEPVQNLMEDVPAVVKQFITNNPDIPAVVKLMEDLNWSTM